jgi:hypothetical protein
VGVMRIDTRLDILLLMDCVVVYRIYRVVDDFNW